MTGSTVAVTLAAAGAKVVIGLDRGAAGWLIERLPVSGCLRLWGGEAYIDLGLDFWPSVEGALADTVCAGEVAWWPDGRALSLFFGPTPVTLDGRIRAAGRVLVVGRIDPGCMDSFSGLCDGETVEIRVEQQDR